MLSNWYNKIIFGELSHVCHGESNWNFNDSSVFITFNQTSEFFQLEFLESAAGTCTFGGIYVLGLEMVSSHYRVIAITLIGLSHPIGEIIFGALASYCHDFRMLLRIFYLPGLILFIYFWIIPESIRWLLVSGHVDRAIKVLKRIARVNKKHLSNKSIDLLITKYSNRSVKHRQHTPSVFRLFCTVFQSRRLVLRLMNCCYCWMTCCFCYYGLNLSSTLIPGADRYLGFIVVVAAEIPGILIQIPLLKRFKRRTSLFVTFAIAAISIVATSFISEQHSTVVLIFYMIGKASVTLAFALVYIYTAEMWPTNLRTSIMNTCSMVGRIGSMISPLIVILVRFHAKLWKIHSVTFFYVCYFSGLPIWFIANIPFCRISCFGSISCCLQSRNLFEKTTRYYRGSETSIDKFFRCYVYVHNCRTV